MNYPPHFIIFVFVDPINQVTDITIHVLCVTYVLPTHTPSLFFLIDCGIAAIPLSA